jgi:hypothetical protein
MKAVICQRHVRLANGAQWEGKAINNQPGGPLKGKEIPEFIVFPGPVPLLDSLTDGFDKLEKDHIKLTMAIGISSYLMCPLRHCPVWMSSWGTFVPTIGQCHGITHIKKL